MSCGGVSAELALSRTAWRSMGPSTAATSNGSTEELVKNSQRARGLHIFKGASSAKSAEGRIAATRVR